MTDVEASMNKVEITAEIVSAYVEHNSVPAGELPTLIKSVHDSLGLLFGERKAEAEAEPLQPKVSIKKSITADYLVCLEDGRRFKSLKRHLYAEHGLSPDEYRSKWGLGKDYPMVAPAYADARSNLAKTIGLGRKTAPAATFEPVQEAQTTAEVDRVDADAETSAKKPGRRKAKAA